MAKRRPKNDGRSLFDDEAAETLEARNAERGTRNDAGTLPTGSENTAVAETRTESKSPTSAAGRSSGSSALRAPRSAFPTAGTSTWVIDANSLIFQVFHAIPEMTSPQGQPVNAVFGFARDLLYLLETKKPDFWICAFDLNEPTFRHTRYPEYKAHRSECPPELIPQFPLIRKLVEAMGLPIIEHADFEADDVLATVAARTEEQGGDCFLVTADKDARQLLSDRVKIFNVRKQQVYDGAALATDWGVRPDQVVDFQALVGDSVDGVPGVPQIGPKAAKDLLTQYDTLDGVYAHVEEITAKARKATLIENRDKAYLSQELVRLERNMPIEMDWLKAQAGQVDGAACVALCTELGFHGITSRFRNYEGAKPKQEDWQATYKTVATEAELRSLVEQMQSQPRLSVDTETTHVSPTWAELVGYSFSWQPGEAYYVPVRAPAGEPQIEPALAADILRPVLENAAVGKVGQNLKYDQIALRSAGIELQGTVFDTLLAAYLLDAGERNHNLDELALRHLNHTNITIESLIGTGKNQITMDQVPVAKISDYAAEDADVALRLVDVLEPKLRDTGTLEKLFRDVEVPLVGVLADLESAGIRVDASRLNELSARYTEEMARIEKEIYALAGKEFNIASPKQLQVVLFEELKLPVISRTKTGPSTDADVLEELASHHPLPAKIVEYRQFAKLKGTYVDALPQLVNPRTGRVHCSLHQAVAATGRLSSSDPNLQNIPIRTAAGREIRSAFLPGQDDWILLSADYSQIELRVLAHYSGDERLCAAFAAGEDIHTAVAAEVNGVAIDQVTREMRSAAKAVNFGIIYGQSAFGLAKALGIKQDEAAAFIENYFGKYPGVERFMQQVLIDCDRDGFVSTILGRRRAVRGVRTDGGRQRNLAERTAINSVIQGSAADLIKLAMIAVHRRVQKELAPAKMLLQIHDELLFETPLEHQGALAELVRTEMTGVMQLNVPLVVDVKVGKNWAETEAVE